MSSDLHHFQLSIHTLFASFSMDSLAEDVHDSREQHASDTETADEFEGLSCSGEISYCHRQRKGTETADFQRLRD